jgi:hypothetical protein
MATNTTKLDTDAIATQFSEMLDADLTGTPAIMSGILQSIREDAKPDAIASARYSADALRLELNKWRQPVRADDTVKALRAAGAAAAKR